MERRDWGKMIGTYSNTALAWGRNVKEAALYFEYVIPLDCEDNSTEELFAVLPESMMNERFEGAVKELWDVYHLYWESQCGTSYFYEPCLRGYQTALKIFEERYSLTELPIFGHSGPGISLSNDEIPYLALQNLQIIDPSQLTWDLVLEFRKDPDAVNKVQRLRCFLESNYTNKSRRFIEDDLAIKTEDYQSALKKWGFETEVGIIEILLRSKTTFDSIAACLAFALSGDMVFSAEPFTAGILIETSSVAVKLNKRSKGKDELKRNNPYDYLIELNMVSNNRVERTPRGSTA